jgi:GT2 family glycosyltransferase
MVLRLAAVVPATNMPTTLASCLDAINRASDPPDEVIVVDSPVCAGPAEARNAGVSQTDVDIIVFVDADAEVHEDAFSRIRAAFEDDPGLDAIFGSYDAMPRADSIVSSFRNLLHHHVHHSSPGAANTFWAGLGAIRRDAFVAAGGFDARRYPSPSIEDVDLGMRLTAAGARIELDPRVQATHLKKWTVAEMARTDLFRRGAPWIALLIEHRVYSSVLNLGWRHRLSTALCLLGAGAAFRGKPRSVGAAGAALVALNCPFYRLLWHRGGARLAVSGVALHVLHHFTAAAAVPVGVVLHLRGRR